MSVIEQDEINENVAGDDLEEPKPKKKRDAKYKVSTIIEKPKHVIYLNGKALIVAED